MLFWETQPKYKSELLAGIASNRREIPAGWIWVVLVVARPLLAALRARRVLAVLMGSGTGAEQRVRLMSGLWVW